MPRKPFDPALGIIHKSRRKGNKRRGQHGYGVQYAQGRFRGEHLQDMEEHDRSGSYEAQNMGGYGTGQLGAPEQTQGDQDQNTPVTREDVATYSQE